MPNGGAYTTAYDIWSGRRFEIMLWVNRQGAHQPWASAYDAQGNPIPDAANVNVGGHVWNAHYNGGVQGRHVISLVRTTNANAGTIDLDWIDNANNEQGFSIERSLSSGSGFTEIDTVAANVTSYTDTGLTTGTTYYYRVLAFNVGGFSGYSNEASAAPQQLGGGIGLNGEYYDNADLANLIFTRTDAQINFD